MPAPGIELLLSCLTAGTQVLQHTQPRLQQGAAAAVGQAC
jgi:hypothetical protein